MKKRNKGSSVCLCSFLTCLLAFFASTPHLLIPALPNSAWCLVLACLLACVRVCWLHDSMRFVHLVRLVSTH
ncbi:uncharacterized protein J3D65DRAFT_639137 [Phyllosticta citribraziliensis]|uniref:Secreted peptide n=1 Tax=Phyllosticta citribraziliensis TaxID=989973 RepID=A0ABR1LA19_9PEZI